MRACTASMVCVMALTTTAAGQDAGHQSYQSYGNAAIQSETLLDNERIVVQRFVIPPGASEGNHAHAGNQLWIQMTAGEWTSHSDRTQVSRVEAGAVGWQPAVVRAEDHQGSTNSGSTPIEMLWVTL